MSDVESIVEEVRLMVTMPLSGLSGNMMDYEPENISQLCIAKEELEKAAVRAEKEMPGLVEAIRVSRKNIEKYHRAQFNSRQNRHG